MTVTSDDQARQDRARRKLAGRRDQALAYAAVLTCQAAASGDGDMTAAVRDLLAARTVLRIKTAVPFDWTFDDADVPEIVSRAMALAEGVTS